jgi:flagellar hook-associated protein 1 FlgK
VQSAATALHVNQLGLQVVGNNIANVNTPGYIRQQLIQSPAVGYRLGDLVIGQGVRADSVRQVVDELLLDRLRKANSELAYQEHLEANHLETESLLNELTDRDFSSSLNRFASAFQEIANQPGSLSMRQLALQRGQEIAQQLQSFSQSIQASAARSRQAIYGTADDINRLTSSIAKLNQRITELEGGSITKSDAVGLRDERIQALQELSHLIPITATQQLDGTVTVLAGGDYIVASNQARSVRVQVLENDPRGIEVRFVDSDSPIPVEGGRLLGLYQTSMPSRPGGIQEKLDRFAGDLMRIVNGIHAQGQGLTGFRQVASDFQLGQTHLPFEHGNPELDIDSGAFTITVSDSRTSTTRTVEIPVRQLGLSDDTTPQQLVAAIDAISGLSARVTTEGRLEILSDSEAIRFSFSDDSSGILSALGINTFFRGSSALDIEVRSELIEDPNHIAASLQGIGAGADNAIAIAEAFSSGHPELEGRSINDRYESILSESFRAINEQKGVADGVRNFRQSLEAQHLGITGVNLDEEAVKMLMYQRAFQATSKVISTAAEMIQTLVEMI